MKKEPWQLTLDEYLECESPDSKQLRGIWSIDAVDRVDRQGNSIYGPALSALYSCRIRFTYVGSGDPGPNPKRQDIALLQSFGFESKPGTKGRVMIGPVRIQHDKAIEDAIERGRIPPKHVLSEYRGRVWLERAFNNAPWQKNLTDFLAEHVNEIHLPFSAACRFVLVSLGWANSVLNAVHSGEKLPERRVMDAFKETQHQITRLPRSLAKQYPNVWKRYGNK